MKLYQGSEILAGDHVILGGKEYEVQLVHGNMVYVLGKDWPIHASKIDRVLRYVPEMDDVVTV